MRELWRTTLNILKGYPALCLPLVGASLASFYLEWLNTIAARRISRWLLTTHSVLGFATPTSGSGGGTMDKGLQLVLPLALAIRVVIFSGYIAAFVLTARAVRDLLKDQRPNWINAASFLRSRIVRVSIFAVTVLVAFGILSTGFSLLFNLQTTVFLRRDFFSSTLIGIAAFIVYAIIAWIMVPISLRLIIDQPSASIHSQTKTQGRIAAIAVAAVSVALTKYVSSVTPSINLTLETLVWPRRLLIWPGITILEDFPLALLWVFLALLAYEDLQMTEIPSPS
jgi:hypothetical protein